MRRYGDGGRYILLSERIKEENGLYTAFCDELGIATYAQSHDAAKRRLTKSILLMLNKATENGDIDELLSMQGVREYPLGHGALGLAHRPITTVEAGDSTFEINPGTAHRPYLLCGTAV